MFALFARGEVTIASLEKTRNAREWRIEGNSEALCPKHQKKQKPAVELIDNDREEPTDEVLERARRLQALAIDKGAAEGERHNAWAEFEKLWKKYRLPTDIGIE
jgi:hypothetical protein